MKIDFVWSIVRHPIDYYESVWSWLKKNPHGTADDIAKVWSWHPLMRPAQLFDLDFNAWVNQLIDDQGDWITRLFWMYVGPEGGEFCQYIGHTETLEKDFIKVLGLLGYDELVKNEKETIEKTRKPHQSGRVRETITWDSATRKRAETTESLIIKRWYSCLDSQNY